MKIPDKQELQEIAINHLSDTDFEEIKTLYRKCSTHIYSFFVIDTTRTLYNPYRFSKNLLAKPYRVVMTMKKLNTKKLDEEIRHEKLQYDINSAPAKISALSPH